MKLTCAQSLHLSYFFHDLVIKIFLWLFFCGSRIWYLVVKEMCTGNMALSGLRPTYEETEHCGLDNRLIVGVKHQHKLMKIH